MNASALPRWRSGQVSETSAAPLAHSPPIPMPRQMRKIASSSAELANPQAAVNTEYSSTLAISARVRPQRSASTPNVSPPAAAASSVTDCSVPAVVRSMPSPTMSFGSTSA